MSTKSKKQQQQQQQQKAPPLIEFLPTPPPAARKKKPSMLGSKRKEEENKKCKVEVPPSPKSNDNLYDFDLPAGGTVEEVVDDTTWGLFMWFVLEKSILNFALFSVIEIISALKFNYLI